MLFHSTRGQDKDKTFEQILMQGLADDGGLFMPDYWPQVDIEYLKNLESFIMVTWRILVCWMYKNVNSSCVQRRKSSSVF